MTYPGLAAFGYDYTARNQLKDMTFGGANVVGYTYDANGNPLTRAPGTNPTASSFAFDAMNRVTDITHNFDVGAKTYHYTYDEVGNRSTIRRDGGVIDTLGYDNNSQMTSFSLGGVVTNLTYDASGNRTKVGTTNYAMANNLNQYTTVGTTSPGYSTNGNLNSYNGWSYSFDAVNRLTSAAQGSTSANFYYDGLGRQIARTLNGVASYSLWDGGNRVAEYGTVGTVLNRWIYAGGDLVRSGTAALRYYYADGLGSTSHLADASGNLLERYTYDLAGTPSIYAPGSVVPLSGSAYGVDMLFTGQKWYPALGLYDLRARAYLPSLGRFLQPDSIGFAGDPTNMYRYCGNNPVNWSDPSGLVTNRIVVTGKYIPYKKDGSDASAGNLAGIGSINGDVSSGGDGGPGEGVFTMDRIVVTATEIPKARTTPMSNLAFRIDFATLTSFGSGFNSDLLKKDAFVMEQEARLAALSMASPVVYYALLATAAYLAANRDQIGDFTSELVGLPGENYAPTTIGGTLGFGWHFATGFGFDDNGRWHSLAGPFVDGGGE